MFRVIVDFADLQDGKHRYHGGDTYPRDGYKPSPERIAELSGHGNRMNRPLISVVSDEPEQVKQTQKKQVRKRTKKATATE